MKQVVISYEKIAQNIACKAKIENLSKGLFLTELIRGLCRYPETFSIRKLYLQFYFQLRQTNSLTFYIIDMTCRETSEENPPSKFMI